MTLDVKFEEQSQSFDTTFNEQNQSFNVDFGEVQTVGGGENGATFIPNVSQSGIISWTNDKGLENPTPINIKGAKGDKGDKGDRGEQGIQGIQGAKGTDGKDGYTPIKGVDYFDGVNGKDGINGKDGKDGINGTNGTDGKDGQDGFSPIVQVADIEGGHRVTITDKNGTKTFDVMDGKDGQGGSGGGVQADWNQSDSTAQDYIKNRPFYAEYEYEPIEFSFANDDFIDLSPFGLGVFSKVSDRILTKEQMLGSHLDWDIMNTYNITVVEYDDQVSALSGQDVYIVCTMDDTGYEDRVNSPFIVAKQSGVVNIMGIDVVIPSTGMYSIVGEYFPSHCYKIKDIKKIDYSYINHQPNIHLFWQSVNLTSSGSDTVVWNINNDALIRSIGDVFIVTFNVDDYIGDATPKQLTVNMSRCREDVSGLYSGFTMLDGMPIFVSGEVGGRIIRITATTLNKLIQDALQKINA